MGFKLSISVCTSNIAFFLFRCKHFQYVNISAFPSVRGDTGSTKNGHPTQLFLDNSILEKLGVPDDADVAHLDKKQVTVLRAGVSICFALFCIHKDCEFL